MLSRRVLIFSILAWFFALFVAIDCIPIAAKYGVWEICVFAWSLVIVPPVLLGRLLMRFDKLGCFFVMDFYVFAVMVDARFSDRQLVRHVFAVRSVCARHLHRALRCVQDPGEANQLTEFGKEF